MLILGIARETDAISLESGKFSRFANISAHSLHFINSREAGIP